MPVSISRLDTLLHHSDTTTTQGAEMVVSARGTASARPAKLIAAERASHVVAARILLDPRAAARAERDIVLVLLHPTFELAANRLLTADCFSMPHIAALEAHLCGAGWAHYLADVSILRLDMRLTPCLGAPAHQWISLECLLVFEAGKFLNKGGHVALGEDLLDIFIGDGQLAVVLETL